MELTKSEFIYAPDAQDVFANGYWLPDVYDVTVDRTADGATVVLHAVKDEAKKTADVYPFGIGDDVIVKVQWLDSGEWVEAKCVCTGITCESDHRRVGRHECTRPPVVAALVVRR